jgi:cation diffusion facilitator CzcD-associated flavoprotein CzcO
VALRLLFSRATMNLPPPLPTPRPDAPERLDALRRAVAQDLEVLSYPSVPWKYTRDPGRLEVAIIGAGHTGKSLAFGLRRSGVPNVRLFDRNPKSQLGPWRTYGRNRTLRTPKDVVGGLDWGIPNLNIRRWCDARYGPDYWNSIRLIPRELWADYLDWYAETLALPIQYETSIDDVTWDAAKHCFQLKTSQGPVEARFVVFATGILAAGGPQIPKIVRDSLPSTAYAHSADPIDFTALRGKRVLVVGGGASAFDNANLALENGAIVDLVLRRSKLTNINRFRWSEWNGFHRHYPHLDDATKWFYTLEETRLGQLPPAPTYAESIQNPRFTLRENAEIESLRLENGVIHGVYGGKALEHDFMICGTGFHNNLAAQTELRSLRPHIALWKDRYQPDPALANEEMSDSPYLGPNLEFTPKDPAHAYLSRAYYLYTGLSSLSGFRADLSSLQFVAPNVCDHIARQLFLEHQPEIRASFEAYDVEEY